ncbi:MAG: glycosyltransferase family 2 protein [Janthinobacterium lividum]
MRLSASAEPARPQISIGVPVYNGGPQIARALDALLEQDFADFEIVISDNASTDETESVARRYAAADKRIRYYRQPTNIGALRNFAFVLEMAAGDYFMWAAADDLRSKNFLRVNYNFLVVNPKYSASISKTSFEGGSGFPDEVGDNLLDDVSLDRRIIRFLSAPHANSGFYSLFRRAPLIAAMNPIEWYFGFDWTIMMRVATTGPMARLEQGWFARGGRGMSTDHDYLIRSTRIRRINWILPFYDFSLVVLRCARKTSWRSQLTIARLLLRLNHTAFRAQLSHTLKAMLSRRPINRIPA